MSDALTTLNTNDEATDEKGFHPQGSCSLVGVWNIWKTNVMSAPLIKRSTQGSSPRCGGIGGGGGCCIGGTKLLQRDESWIESILPNEEDEIVSQANAGRGLYRERGKERVQRAKSSKVFYVTLYMGSNAWPSLLRQWRDAVSEL